MPFFSSWINSLQAFLVSPPLRASIDPPLQPELLPQYRASP